MIERLMQWLGLAPRIRRVPISDPVRKLDKVEMNAAFSVAADNGLWLAVNQLLKERLDSAVVQVSAPALAERPGAQNHTAGGLEWLSDFQALLHDHWRKANGRNWDKAEVGKRKAEVSQAVMPKESGKTDSQRVQTEQGPPAPPGEPSDAELLNG